MRNVLWHADYDAAKQTVLPDHYTAAAHAVAC